MEWCGVVWCEPMSSVVVCIIKHVPHKLVAFTTFLKQYPTTKCCSVWFIPLQISLSLSLLYIYGYLLDFNIVLVIACMCMHGSKDHLMLVLYVEVEKVNPYFSTMEPKLKKCWLQLVMVSIIMNPLVLLFFFHAFFFPSFYSALFYSIEDGIMKHKLISLNSTT